MPQIRYRLHFLTLLPAAILFWLVARTSDALPAGNTAFFLLFGSMGILHATSLVIALRDRTAATLGRVVIFLILVGALSVATIFSPLLLVPVLKLLGWRPINGDSPIVLLVPAFASAFGASGYWFLLRTFWVKSQKLVKLIPTIALCSFATIVSWPSGGKTTFFDREVADLIPTYAWWVAFSLSLYFGDVLWRSEKKGMIQPQPHSFFDL